MEAEVVPEDVVAAQTMGEGLDVVAVAVAAIVAASPRTSHVPMTTSVAQEAPTITSRYLSARCATNRGTRPLNVGTAMMRHTS